VIDFSPHAKERMIDRGISEEQVLDVISNPDKKLKDLKTGRDVYVKDGIFVILEDNLVVTVWYSNNWVKVVERKVRSGKWAEG